MLPMISPDGTTLVYFSNQVQNPIDQHDHHYYWTKRDGEVWSIPTKIGLFNNIGDEFDGNYFMGFDGEILYFYRPDNRSVIFQSKFIDGEFSVPETWDYKKLTKGEIFHYYLGNPNKMFFADKSAFDSRKPDSEQNQKVYEIYFDNYESSDRLELPAGIVKEGIYGLIPLGNNGLLYSTYSGRKSKRPEFFVITQNNDNWSIPIKITIDQFSRKEFGAISSYSEKTNEIFFTANNKIYLGKLPEQLIKRISTDYPSQKEIAVSSSAAAQEPNMLKPEKSKYYALLIAIEDYQNNEGTIIDLDNPINDATMLMSSLVEKYTFNKDNITILKNPERADIINAFEDLSEVLTEKDNLLIFYAGHGFWDDKLNIGYWLSSDASAESKANWISNSTIRDYIGGLNTRHTLLISDACFSGSIFKTREVRKSIDDYGFYRLNKLPSRKAMTSGTYNTVPDNSKFMWYLLKSLDGNEKEYFTSTQLFHDIEIAVINNTNNIPQFGTIQNTGDEGGDFIFIKKEEHE